MMYYIITKRAVLYILSLKKLDTYACMECIYKQASCITR